MAYTLVPTELIQDGAVTSAKLDTNIAISGTLSVGGVTTLATHLVMGDNDKIKIGTGGDLEIYHDASNSYIANSTGNLYIGDTNGSVHIQAKLNEDSIVAAADGAVTLYYDNAPKLATSSAGVTVTGNASFADNGKATFGDAVGGDLQIFHTGTYSAITDVGTGALFIGGSDYVDIGNSGLSQTRARFYDNTVELRSGGDIKLNTTATGIDVTGVITTDGLTTSADINFGDSDKAVFGAGSDLQIYHDGGNSVITNSTGNLIIRDSVGGNILIQGLQNQPSVDAIANGAVNLYYSGNPKLATTSTGIDVTGTATMDGLTVDGTGTLSTIGNGTQQIRTYVDADEVSLLTEGSARLDLWTGGNRTMRLATNGDISFYEDTGTTAKFFWDASAESLGIGTTSPYGKLRLNETAGSCQFYITSSNTSDSSIIFGSQDDLATGSISYFHSDDSLRFSGYNNQEAFRIDSSGNLLVGTTSVQGDSGVTLANTGYVFASRPSSVAIYAKRTGTDGAIQEFRKDSATVGSIGTVASRLFIGNDDTFLTFQGASDRIYPANSSGGARDAVIDLGLAGGRFRDLYLSGSLYHGGSRQFVRVATSSGGGGVFGSIANAPQTGFLYIYETGTTNYAIVACFKKDSASNVTTTLIANSSITVTATNPGGTVATGGYTTSGNVKMQSIIIRET